MHTTWQQEIERRETMILYRKSVDERSKKNCYAILYRPFTIFYRSIWVWSDIIAFIFCYKVQDIEMGFNTSKTREPELLAICHFIEF